MNKAGRTPEEKEADLNLILRKVERSDNESLRAKKEIMIPVHLHPFLRSPRGRGPKRRLRGVFPGI